MNASEIIDIAKSCLDTPFQHQGRVKGEALDCAGLIVQIAKELNINHIDKSAYSLNSNDNSMLETLQLQEELIEVPKDEFLKGDVVLIRIGRELLHLAVFNEQTIIHAYEPVGLTCEHDINSLWLKRVIKVFRFKGVTWA